MPVKHLYMKMTETKQTTWNAHACLYLCRLGKKLGTYSHSRERAAFENVNSMIVCRNLHTMCPSDHKHYLRHGPGLGPRSIVGMDSNKIRGTRKTHVKVQHLKRCVNP